MNQRYKYLLAKLKSKTITDPEADELGRLHVDITCAILFDEKYKDYRENGSGHLVKDLDKIFFNALGEWHEQWLKNFLKKREEKRKYRESLLMKYKMTGSKNGIVKGIKIN